MTLSKINPVRAKLQVLLESRRFTKEEICVATDIRYPTLENLFWRDTITPRTLNGLVKARIISHEELDEYYQWLSQYNHNHPVKKKRKKRKKRRKKYARKARSKNKAAKPEAQD
jgi:hypothetical protein